MPPKRVPQKLPACGFYVTVHETDHSVPIKVKKVAKGKRVSILSGITGSRSAAVSTLKQILGVGGEVSIEVANAIELQGDQTGRIANVLRNLDALRGEPVVPSVTAAVQPKQGYEKFMKQKEPTAAAVFPAPEMSKACILVHGRYWPYCNGSCSFCPPLTDVFEGLDVYCSWFDPMYAQTPARPQEENSGLAMTKAELATAFSALGMKAEVGRALLSYAKEKRMLPAVGSSSAGPGASGKTEAAKPVPVVKARPVAVKKQPFIDRPVRVILNQPESDEEDAEWYVMEISLRDVSQWMSDYEQFVASLFSEASIAVAHQELLDSRTLKLWFLDKQNMEECGFVLNEVMPEFFSLKKREPLFPPDFLLSAGVTESEESSPRSAIDLVQGPLEDGMNFERMAEDLGLGDNTVFWEKFTQLVDNCDGTNDGLLRAFEAAVVAATDEP